MSSPKPKPEVYCPSGKPLPPPLALPKPKSTPPTAALVPVEVLEGLPPAGINDPDNRGESVLSFFTIEGLDKALDASEFSADEEFKLLTEIARDSADRYAQLAALKVLHDRLREVLLMSGNLQKMTATRTLLSEDGSEITAHQSAFKLKGTGQTTEQMLQVATRLTQTFTLPADPGEEDDQSKEDSENAESNPEDSTPDSSPSPQTSAAPADAFRDIGGGGLCESARAAADAARHRAANARPGSAPLRAGTPGDQASTNGTPAGFVTPNDRAGNSEN